MQQCGYIPFTGIRTMYLKHYWLSVIQLRSNTAHICKRAGVGAYSPYRPCFRSRDTSAPPFVPPEPTSWVPRDGISKP